jgi:DNA adenine methylase
LRREGVLYLNAFAAEDHERLAGVLNALADRPWVLTYDNAPQVAELYSERRRREFELNYSAHRVGKATEVVVLSDALPDIAQGWPLTPEL